jgi:inorganic triphosphatase YgiF
MGETAQELEIKLVGTAADMAGLLDSPAFCGFACGPAVVERLVTVYFDTPYRALARKGLSLRLREETAGVVQTVKGERRGEGAFSRREWERRFPRDHAFPVATGASDFAAIDARIGAVAPVACVVCDRSTVELDDGASRIEAAVDLGRLELLAGGSSLRSAPLAEFEIELLAGKPRAIFRIARRLAAAADGRLQVCVVSKGARALRLADARLPKDIRPEAPADASAADFFAVSLRQHTARIADLRAFVADLRAPEAAHLMRVALRRLRVLIGDHRRELRCERLERAAARARAFARALAPARDLDVFIAGALAEARARAGDGAGFAALSARADALRARAWSDAAAACASREFARFAIDLLEAAHLERWRKTARRRLDRSAGEHAARALERRRRTALARSAAMDGADIDARHRLRLAVKSLRYSAQAFRPFIENAGRRPYMSSLSRLQDELGALSDARVACDLAERAAKGAGPEAARAAGVVQGLNAAAARLSAERAGALWRDFEGLAPYWRCD